MTPRERRGKKSVKKRVSNKEIVLATSDKSGKYVVTTPEIYKYAARKHVDKDQEVKWEDVKKTETLLNRYTIHLADSFGMGENHSEVDRIHKALKSTGNAPPPLDISFKDHKVTEIGEPCPSTRPVCRAKEGPQSRCSQLLSQILTQVVE